MGSSSSKPEALFPERAQDPEQDAAQQSPAAAAGEPPPSTALVTSRTRRWSRCGRRSWRSSCRSNRYAGRAPWARAAAEAAWLHAAAAQASAVRWAGTVGSANAPKGRTTAACRSSAAARRTGRADWGRPAAPRRCVSPGRRWRAPSAPHRPIGDRSCARTCRRADLP